MLVLLLSSNTKHAVSIECFVPKSVNNECMWDSDAYLFSIVTQEDKILEGKICFCQVYERENGKQDVIFVTKVIFWWSLNSVSVKVFVSDPHDFSWFKSLQT